MPVPVWTLAAKADDDPVRDGRALSQASSPQRAKFAVLDRRSGGDGAVSSSRTFPAFCLAITGVARIALRFGLLVRTMQRAVVVAVWRRTSSAASIVRKARRTR